MPHSIVLPGLAIFACFYAFFMLADYGWEKKKQRGLDRCVRTGKWSEATEYEWYSWIRYLAVILLTYSNAVPALESDPERNDGPKSPVRLLFLFCIVILFSIALLAIDGYWERYRPRRFNKTQTAAFWSYFWLRYPALIFVTIQLARRGLY